MVYINDLDERIKSRMRLSVDDIIFFSVIRTAPTPPKYRTTSEHWSPGREVAYGLCPLRYRNVTI